jgi:hypothetical protein
MNNERFYYLILSILEPINISIQSKIIIFFYFLLFIQGFSYGIKFINSVGILLLFVLIIYFKLIFSFDCMQEGEQQMENKKVRIITILNQSAIV